LKERAGADGMGLGENCRRLKERGQFSTALSKWDLTERVAFLILPCLSGKFLS
jgi:hypothetical protein